MKLFATTKKGSNKITFFDSEKFKQIIQALEGDLVIEITQVAKNATASQWSYFREYLVPKFMKLAAENGEHMSKSSAIRMLFWEVRGYGGSPILDFFLSEKYQEGQDVKAVSLVIADIEEWIKGFFEK